MGIHISSDLEIRLAAEAQKSGVSVEDFLDHLLRERGKAAAPSSMQHAELPIWHLGEMGSLHRRDIYDDVD